MLFLISAIDLLQQFFFVSYFLENVWQKRLHLLCVVVAFLKFHLFSLKEADNRSNFLGMFYNPVYRLEVSHLENHLLSSAAVIDQNIHMLFAVDFIAVEVKMKFSIYKLFLSKFSNLFDFSVNLF